MVAVAKHCRCSVISILLFLVTCHFQSSSAFIIRHHSHCLQLRNEYRFTQSSGSSSTSENSSRRSGSSQRNNKTCVSYKSTTSSFSLDIDDEIAAATTLLSNSNDELWQLIYELRQQELNNNDNNDDNCSHQAGDTTSSRSTSSGTRGSNNNDDKKLFEQVIKTLHQECQLNVQTLEMEIDALRQKIENGSAAADFSSKKMIQNNHEFSKPSHHELVDNCINNNSNVNVSNNSVNVDEISSKLLKAIFVGYQWTEDDRKRLASAHPLD
jgi:hypothetical protein